MMLQKISQHLKSWWNIHASSFTLESRVSQAGVARLSRYTVSFLPRQIRFKVGIARLALVTRLVLTAPVAECYAQPDPALEEAANDLVGETHNFFIATRWNSIALGAAGLFLIACDIFTYGGVTIFTGTIAIRYIAGQVILTAHLPQLWKMNQMAYAQLEAIQRQNQLWRDSNAEFVQQISNLQQQQSAMEDRRKLLEQKMSESWWHWLKTELPNFGSKVWGWRWDHYIVHPVLYFCTPIVVIFVVWYFIPYYSIWYKAWEEALYTKRLTKEEAAEAGFKAAGVFHKKFKEDLFGKPLDDDTMSTPPAKPTTASKPVEKSAAVSSETAKPVKQPRQ